MKNKGYLNALWSPGTEQDTGGKLVKFELSLWFS